MIFNQTRKRFSYGVMDRKTFKILETKSKKEITTNIVLESFSQIRRTRIQDGECSFFWVDRGRVMGELPAGGVASIARQCKFIKIVTVISDNLGVITVLDDNGNILSYRKLGLNNVRLRERLIAQGKIRADIEKFRELPVNFDLEYDKHSEQKGKPQKRFS